MTIQKRDKYEMVLVYRGQTTFIVEADNPAQAFEMARTRWENGETGGDNLGADWEEIENITEVCVLTPGQEPLLDKSKWTGADSETPNTQLAIELLDELIDRIDDIHNPIPSDLHERVQAIKNAIKGDDIR